MKLSVYLLFIALSMSIHAGVRYKWTVINLPDEQNTYRIIDIDKNNTIWISDLKFNIYKKEGVGNWVKFSSPYPDTLQPVSIVKIDEETFAAWAYDKAYRSHIRIFKGRNWQVHKYIVDVPVNNFLKCGENQYYVYGNFGALYYLNNNIFSPVDNPFKNHIQTAILTADGTVWFGTKYDGIYKYRDGLFTKINFADNSNYEIVSMAEKDNIIYAYHNEYNTFELRENKFIKSRLKPADISGTITDNKVGLTSFSFLKESERIHVNYPSSYKPSQVFTKDKSAVYIISGGRLLKGTSYDNFYFYELGGSYLVDGTDQNTSTQVFFNDLNRDGNTDLFVHNSYPADLLNVYVANYKYPFMERAFKVEGLEYYSNRVYKFSDLNDDYYDDLIVSFSDSIGSGIAIFLNKKNFTFSKHKTLYSPVYLLKSAVKNIETVDIDNDGDLDINLTYYYGTEDQPGNEIFYYNKFKGQLFTIDTSFKQLTRGWTVKSIFADVDNDGDLDWYQALVWWKDKLHINDNGTYRDVSGAYLNDLYQNTQGAGFADIDNDGDLDLIRTGDEQLISISLNSGNGVFTDATDSLINRYNDLKLFSYGSNKSINIFDINNDGFLDILLVTSFPKDNKTSLLLNYGGKAFKNYTDFKIPGSESFIHSACADVDADGDLDIYLLKSGRNQLLINNLDNNNYIRLKLEGIESNTGAKNSKVWIYKKTKENSKDILAGYRETGVSSFSGSYSNEDIVHFGADTSGIYDIIVKFQSGKTVILSGIKPPFSQTVYENEGIYKEAVVFSSGLFNLMMERDIQYYSIIILVTIIIIGLSIRYGHENFNWGIKLSIGLVIINFSLFWIILLLASDSDSAYLKFFLPFIVASLGVITPNIIFYNLKSNIIRRNLNEYKDELLNQAINFSHGEWALKNINSLIFLLQSLPPDIYDNEKYIKQLKDRVSTFDSLTVKSIDKIIYILNQIDADKEAARRLVNTMAELKALNSGIMKNDFLFSDRDRQLYPSLKELIKSVRNKVITEYSSNPVEVIDRVLETKKTSLKIQGIDIEFLYPAELNKSALIKPNELADVIDNSLANAVRAFKNKSQRSIVIEIKWAAPKFRIYIMNTGEKINEENWTKIFEKGFSTSGGSGIGLFNARNTLKKYGGRIELQSSGEESTTFLLELNEGDINEAEYSDN